MRSSDEHEQTLSLKFSHTDNGNCRVYYRSGKNLYAYQEDRIRYFTLYRCSQMVSPSIPLILQSCWMEDQMMIHRPGSPSIIWLRFYITKP